VDRLPRCGTASSLSRIRAATLRPVVRASCLNRRSVVSGSFTVIPFIITYHGNPILTESQYRTLGAGWGCLGNLLPLCWFRHHMKLVAAPSIKPVVRIGSTRADLAPFQKM